MSIIIITTSSFAIGRVHLSFRSFRSILCFVLGFLRFVLAVLAILHLWLISLLRALGHLQTPVPIASSPRDRRKPVAVGRNTASSADLYSETFLGFFLQVRGENGRASCHYLRTRVQLVSRVIFQSVCV
jgi:hypothetical protein